MNIGSRIQYLRKTRGISQEELANCIGVSSFKAGCFKMGKWTKYA